MTIPVFRSQHLDWKRARELHEAYGDDSQLSNFGPLVQKLEEELAAVLRVEKERLVVFSSGTLAIEAAVATTPGKRDSVAIPDFSFLATYRAVQGSFPGIISALDSEIEDWTIRDERRSFDLYVPVCVFGSSPKYLLSKFSGRTSVVDAAASLGALPDLSCLESTHAVSFSLHSTKVLGSGEGGFTVFGDFLWAERARQWANFGRSSGSSFLDGGTNAKMSEVQAAFTLAQLEKFADNLPGWKYAQDLAREATRRLKLETHPHAFENPNPYWVVKFQDESQRVRAEKLLRARDIEFRSWWPLSLAKLNKQPELPNARNLRETTLGLPMYLGISEEAIQSVERALKEL